MSEQKYKDEIEELKTKIRVRYTYYIIPATEEASLEALILSFPLKP